VNSLVDTSVWSRALRRKPQDLSAADRALIDELTELIKEGRSRIIGPVRQELLSGIKIPAQFEELRLKLRAFPDEPVGTSDYEAAAQAGNACRSKGIAVSAVDILICAVAIARRWSIFSTDPDFRNYAKVLPIQIHLPRR
jgi:predicted nucleic acid-binding protein